MAAQSVLDLDNLEARSTHYVFIILQHASCWGGQSQCHQDVLCHWGYVWSARAIGVDSLFQMSPT